MSWITIKIIGTTVKVYSSLAGARLATGKSLRKLKKEGKEAHEDILKHLVA